MSQLRQRESEFALLPPLCFIQALSGLDGAHAHRGGRAALLSSPVRMLVSSRSHRLPTPHPRGNNIFPAIWASLS